MNTLFTCSLALRTVAVEATILGLTVLPSSVQPDSSSTTDSYKPTIVPSGPLMRWNSSWMIRSGGWIGATFLTLTAGEFFDAGMFARAIAVRPHQAGALAFLIHATKQRAHLTAPRHHGELVHGGDHHRRRTVVDLLIHRQHRDAGV